MERQRILVDTSILIDHLRKAQKNQTYFYRATLQYECVISAITEFEFVVGCTPNNAVFVQHLLQIVPVLGFDSECVKTAATIYQQLKRKNQLISLPDLFIGATALTHNISLLTLNQVHFKRISGLTLCDLY
ncbi:PilT protein domain protein [Candidatus Moduliflexus flocculans]|uniref:PilT protein domain protein n=1 Tax=Candidatus Moduliflexus flocculans TaxID=1499966 RepID=A0A0S6VTN2_9BACT|nr:PilT protein domain protein [Candidatus Moduliflexus flocculans]